MHIFPFILIFVTVFAHTSCNTNVNDTKLVDGTYTGKSQATYVDEPYIGKATIVVQNHAIVKVDFQIVDTLQHEVFSSDYDKHFPDNAVYREQCHNDWKGVQLYPSVLLKKQNVDLVDAVTGATWSYNIFKASVKKALNK